MMEVFIADIIKNYLDYFYTERDIYYVPLLIIMGGLGLCMVIGIFLSIALFKVENRLTLVSISIISVFITLFALMFIGYISITSKYPEFNQYSIFEQFALMPQILVFYTIYELKSPVEIWYISIVVYGICMILLTKMTIEVKRKSSKKRKPLIKGLI